MPAYDSNSENETGLIAAQIAQSAQAGSIYALHGPLGAGKSAFARAFIHSLCGPGTEVPSPTFTLVQIYDSPKGSIWHFDLYRLKDPNDLFELGWEEALGGIVLVEWPERAGAIIPKRHHRIHITPTGQTSRRIETHE